eukprot:GHRQ01025985.1.p2 GENE.GHRQ01025985.1~~GHRQ01025985.1.p2  ORF type:complete len:124 (-),score=30.49 GHRQ01025985.1:206-577(-)
MPPLRQRLPVLVLLPACCCSRCCLSAWRLPRTRCSYLRERHQFGAPLASFQLIQEKLARMLGNVQVGGCCGWTHACPGALVLAVGLVSSAAGAAARWQSGGHVGLPKLSMSWERLAHCSEACC